ncbi:hypothetical protein EDF44_3817 [Rathayibacter sp. PhB185]|nr:hypothetical protein EDF45_3882 [Rathayibacter sp. PhB186]ROS46916.1 hypothetical protein EDF44_3817 [Rathayibacter sp. PhB185]
MWMKTHPVYVGALLGAIVALLYIGPVWVSYVFSTTDFGDANEIAIGVMGLLFFFFATVVPGAIVGTYSAVGALASRAVVRRACRRLTVTRESIGAALGSALAVGVPMLLVGPAEPTLLPTFGSMAIPVPAFLAAAGIAGAASFVVNRIQIRPQSI